MRTMKTAIPAACLAIFLMISMSWALPSCCRSGKSSNSPASFATGQGGSLQAPVAPERVVRRRPVPKQHVAVARPIRTTASVQTRRPVPRPQAGQPVAASAPSCCASSSAGYRSVSSPTYTQARPQATIRGISSGYAGRGYTYGCRYSQSGLSSCCGGSGYGRSTLQAGLPSCCGAPGYVTPAQQAGVPSCCAVNGATSTQYRPTSSGTVRPVPASSASNRSYGWGAYPAAAGAFGKPGYFPGSTPWNNRW